MVYLERSRRPLPGILHVENGIRVYGSGLNVILFTPTKNEVFLAPIFTKLACAHQNYVQVAGTEYYPNSSELCADCRYRILPQLIRLMCRLPVPNTTPTHQNYVQVAGTEY